MSRCVTRKFSESLVCNVLVRDKLVKLNDTTKYVELYVEDLRTRVRSPPAPPIKKPHLRMGLFSIWRHIWHI